jgi:hypothetical protein
VTKKSGRITMTRGAAGAPRTLILFLSLSLLLCWNAPVGGAHATEVAPTADTDPSPDRVVLLHGLSRTARSMRHLRAALSKDGYLVENIGYPSSKRPIEELADYLEERLEGCCSADEGKLHFVTHSMGGILVRYYTATRAIPNLGRVVMLSPPNGGSELIDAWLKIPVVREGIGPSRGQLGTDASSLPQQLGPVEFELGIIAGDRSLNPLYSWLIPGQDDGKVSVERAKVSGMTDFLVVPHSHTFIMKSPEVIEQARRFLREGSFDHDDADGEEPDINADERDAEGVPAPPTLHGSAY